MNSNQFVWNKCWNDNRSILVVLLSHHVPAGTTRKPISKIMSIIISSYFPSDSVSSNQHDIPRIEGAVPLISVISFDHYRAPYPSLRMKLKNTPYSHQPWSHDIL